MESGCGWHQWLAQNHLHYLILVLLDVFRAIHVLHIAWRNMQVEVWCVIPAINHLSTLSRLTSGREGGTPYILILRKVIIQFLVEEKASFICPAPRYITNSVTTTSKNQQR